MPAAIDNAKPANQARDDAARRPGESGPGPAARHRAPCVRDAKMDQGERGGRVQRNRAGIGNAPTHVAHDRDGRRVIWPAPHDRDGLCGAERVQPLRGLASVVQAVRTGGDADEQAIDEPLTNRPLYSLL